MKILLIGSGGREHALAWKLSQSAQCSELFIAPGNAGTSTLGTNLPLSITDFDALSQACLQHKITMVLVGPEEPLVKGIYDYFANDPATAHISVIGPSAKAAALEGSKSFAKAFMHRHHIPTAAYREFTAENYQEGVDYIQQQPIPVVLKADGLAAGKGVIICQSQVEALAEFELMLIRSKFGHASDKVVAEAFLQGIEMSLICLIDGKNFLMLPEAKDYKRISEGDKGLNTGGMGAVSPLPFFDEDLRKKVIDKIIEPTLQGLQKDELEYKGFIFFGLMVDKGEPYVIEFNCRMGDPETEVIIPLIENDIVDLLKATSAGTLDEINLVISPQSSVGIVAVSGGYPKDYVKGREISGLDVTFKDSILFHAGTQEKDGKIVTNGGRVLVAVSLGDDIKESAELSDYFLQQLDFEDMAYRRDIGHEFRDMSNAEK